MLLECQAVKGYYNYKYQSISFTDCLFEFERFISFDNGLCMAVNCIKAAFSCSLFCAMNNLVDSCL